MERRGAELAGAPVCRYDYREVLGSIDALTLYYFCTSSPTQEEPRLLTTNPNLVAQRAGRVQLEQRVPRDINHTIDARHRKHHLYVSEESLNALSLLLARSRSLALSLSVSVSIAYDCT